MTTLADEVQVDLAQGRQEAVGVVVNVNDPIAVRHLDPIVGDVCGRQDADPDSLELMVELGTRAIGALDNNVVRQRFEDTHRHTALEGVWPQDGVWVVVCSDDHPFEVAAAGGLRSWCGGWGLEIACAGHSRRSLLRPAKSRSMAVVGMVSHVGRFRAS